MSAEKNPFAKFLNHFKKGSVLFHEGDEGEEMYIIQSGKVAIKKRVPHGETTLAVLEKGDFFGEMAILERMPRSAGAEVLEDGDLIVIGGDLFGDMIKSNPEIALRMLRKYSLRLRETTKQIEQMATSVTAGDPAEPLPTASASKVPVSASTLQTEALGYSIPSATGTAFPVSRSYSFLARTDP